MKSYIIGFSACLMAVITIMIVMTIHGKSIRESETTESLNTCIDQTTRQMMKEKSYTVSNRNEFLADFVERLSNMLSSDASIKVDVLVADEKKGILSVKVTETFKHPNGHSGTVSCTRTNILEDITTSTEKPTYTVKYYKSESDLQNDKDCIKQYDISAGDNLIKPKNPDIDGKTFVCWVDGSGHEVDFSKTVDGNMKYYAKTN